MGLGRFGGGVGVTRWLVHQGARVTVSDAAAAEALRHSLEELRGLDVTLHLGGHEQRDFAEADVVVVNPAVREDSPWLRVARQAGAELTTEINLFVQRCPAKVIGVTGTLGKSTTAAMIAHILRDLKRRVWLGGNIGTSLLESLDQMTPRDWVVLELSSFQLKRTAWIGWSPQIAVLTPIEPNHLDWHGSIGDYIDSKGNIFRFQKKGDKLVLLPPRNMLEVSLRMCRAFRPCYAVQFDNRGRPAISVPCRPDEPVRGLELKVPGRHNLENALLAIAAARAAGVRTERAVRALASFRGLPHRLEEVAQVRGVRFVNDSKSTTPGATITALEAIEGPVLLIVGGYDKGLDISEAAQRIAQRARFAACIGQTGDAWCQAIRAAGGQARRLDDLPAAIMACLERARPDETVLLSPGCASWDQFRDYRQRGDAFRDLARQLATTAQ